LICGFTGIVIRLWKDLNMNIKPIAISFSILALSACASQPQVQPAPPPPPPVVEAPAVIKEAPAPVIQEPVVEEKILPQLPSPGSLEDFILSSGGDTRVYFDYDQYSLTDIAMASLRAQSSWLKSYPNVKIVIEGNADERGTREYNLALGARRAASVSSFMVSQGVSPTQITVVSYGKEKPIDARSNEDGWALNRNANTRLR
jgi:peptidoglycan-associated lipoprotein